MVHNERIQFVTKNVVSICKETGCQADVVKEILVHPIVYMKNLSYGSAELWEW